MYILCVYLHIHAVKNNSLSGDITMCCMLHSGTTWQIVVFLTACTCKYTHNVYIVLSTCWLFQNVELLIYKVFLRRRHSSPYCCWSLLWISADGTFSPTRNLITMRCSTLCGTFCSLITLATPKQDWTGSNPSRREGGGCGFTLSRSHSCCAVRLVYIQISPGHIWTTLYTA